MNRYDALLILLPVFVALAAVRWIYFKMLRISMEKNLVDNPDARKLQKNPVPVVGGLTVFFGLMAGLFAGAVVSNVLAAELSACPQGGGLSYMLPVVLGMSVMLYTGCMDDVLGLSPKARFIVEILVILGLALSTGVYVDSLHLLWDVGRLSMWVALPLTVFAGVGIINAINMMDGVNGLSSGICISCCLLCGIHFVCSDDWSNAILAFCMAASLALFFVHNVFGNTSRMFIGDAGTMLLGTLMSWFVFSIMHEDDFLYAMNYDICPTAMVVALFSVPVADTLRVMTMRVLNRHSPFSPDKTHLHHAFVDMGVSHVATTLAEIVIGLIVVAAWIASVLMGASFEMQLYTVVFVAAILVWGTYFFLVHELKSDSRTARWLRAVSGRTHWEDREWWRRFARYLDGDTES